LAHPPLPLEKDFNYLAKTVEKMDKRLERYDENIRNELARRKRFQEKLDRMKLEDVEGYDEVVFKIDEFLDLPSIQ